MHSYIISRPLKTEGLNLIASHMFIATDAKHPGDPDATIFSFGKNENGHVGRLYDDTYQRDNAAWQLLDGDDNPVGELKIQFRLIPANNHVTKILALSVIEQDDYEYFGPNSNSAAMAIANVAAQKELTRPGIETRLAPGYEDYDLIDFQNSIFGIQYFKLFSRST